MYTSCTHATRLAKIRRDIATQRNVIKREQAKLALLLKALEEADVQEPAKKKTRIVDGRIVRS